VRRVFASAASAPAYSYDPYGNALQGTAPLTDFNYAGMFYNADSGLYLTRYRAYDSIAGRWLSRDPIGEISDHAVNLYRYVNGNPISLNDLLGLCDDTTQNPFQSSDSDAESPPLIIPVADTGNGPDDPSTPPVAQQDAQRNAACTNASYTCLTNSTSPEMSQACQIAEAACNMTVNTLRSEPLGPNVDTIIKYPDGTTVVIQGGPGGPVYVIPSPRPGAASPGPMR
jgi:RHS repeat-associated protein